MASVPVLEAAGLTTSNNQLSGVPRGGMVKATNVVLRNRHVVECRRGQKRKGYSLADANDRFRSGVYYQGSFVGHHGDSPTAPDTLSRDTGAAFSAYTGTFEAPTDASRLSFAEAAGNLYAATADGVKVLDALAGTWRDAGILKMPYEVTGEGGPYGSGTSGWMAADTAVGYRLVLGVKDANDHVKLGAPSARTVFRNVIDALSLTRTANVVRAVTPSGANRYDLQVGDVVTLDTPSGTFGAGPHTITSVSTNYFEYAETAVNATVSTRSRFSASRDVAIAVLLANFPSDLADRCFLRLYRTEATESSDIDPGEEFFLVSEIPITSADVGSGGVYLSDVTPDSMLGPPLYTNPNTGESVVGANEPPPLCRRLAFWDGRLWCVNTTSKQRVSLRLLGLGTPDGLQNGDTITIAGITYTALASPSVATDFLIDESEDSLAKNIARTAQRLCGAVNINASSAVWAYYVSGEEDGPGEIVLEERAVGGAAFTVYASRVGTWGPALTSSSSGAEESTDDRRSNGLAYSRMDEPEAFPLTNWLPVGPLKSATVTCAIPFREKLYCFTDGGKVYAVSGPAPYRVDELDGSARLIAPDSVVVHANQVFALTDQGVGVLTDAGFRIVSRGIEDEVLDVLALDPDVVSRYAFGVSYESERQYILYVPTSDSDTCATAAYVFNSLDETWTKWTGDRTFGVVSPEDGKLYLGDGDAATLREERKAYDRTDFAEDEVTVTISSSSGQNVQLADASEAEVGDILYQSAGVYSLVTDVDTDTNEVMVQASVTWAAGSATLLKPIAVEAKWCPATPGAPSDVYRFRDAVLHFREFSCREFNVTYDTETVQTEQSATLEPSIGFGLNGFGEDPYGDPLGLLNRRVEVALESQLASYIRVGFSISEAWAQWAVNGFTLHVEPAGTGSIS